MRTRFANGDDSRFSLWLRVREFAVPPSMIETATARRRRRGLGGGMCRRTFRRRSRFARRGAYPRPGARSPGPGRSAPSGPRSAALAPAEGRSRRAAAAGSDHRAGPIRPAGFPRSGGSAVRCTLWSGPRRRGRMPVSGSASHCGTDPAPGPACIRIPAPTGGSGSTCTVTCGTRARSDELRIRSGAEQFVADRALRSRAAGVGARRAAPWTGGQPRRGSCCARRGGRPATVRGAVRGTPPTWSLDLASGGDDRARVADHGGTRRAAGRPRCRCCPTRRPGCCPTWNCSAPGDRRPTGCTRWSPSALVPDRPPADPSRIAGPGGPAAPGASAGASGTGSGWSTARWPRSTTTRPRSGGRNCWPR